MSAKNFFTKKQKQQIVQAIRDAEKDTSGEIRLHIESKCKGEPLDRAVKMFADLKMHQTRLRNGTLIYMAVNDQKFAIFGDEGINEIVPDDFWDDVKEKMQSLFREQKFTVGISYGISQIGEKLKEFFSYQDDDVNELPDDISIGE